MSKPLWLLAGVTGIAAAIWFATMAGGPSVSEKPVEKQVEGPAAKSPGKKPAMVRTATAPRVVQMSEKTPLSPDEQAAALNQGDQISGLWEAAAEGTPDKVESVYTALGHPDKEVRSAAVDVVIQMIGRDGIPRLRAAMAAANSVDEKQNLAEAIEFLELPTLSEVRGKAGPPVKLKSGFPSVRPKRTPPPKSAPDTGTGVEP